MDSTLITAMAAALGSLLGAGASIATTWIAQRTQTIRAYSEWKLHQREALYGEFITEASRLIADALTHSLDQPDQLVKLYGLLGRIRLLSDEKVLSGAEACCRRIVELYAEPNLTPEQIRAALKANQIDYLEDFSAACRAELLELSSTA
jgi:hypothetical protein